MKQLIASLLVVSATLYSIPSTAYEVDTHEKLSETAAKSSILSMDTSVLSNLGLPPSIEDNSNPFPNSEGNPKNILNLIKDGSNFEDTVLPYPRVVNHFYNPLSRKGLSGIASILGHPSPDWALEDGGEITGVLGFGKQEYSYQDGREFFYRALTGRDVKGTVVAATKPERDKYFGLTFQTLGQVIHHIQDMAQPQHVRDDGHLGLSASKTTLLCLASPALCAGYFAIKDPSAYESWTNLNDVRKTLPTDFSLVGYDLSALQFTATFNQPRKFWETTAGAGLAQFTNSNFVSAGTNFDTGMFNSPLFTPSLRRVRDIQQMCTNAKPACPNLSGKMTFYGNWVEDRYTGQKKLNPYASTSSLFDSDLKKINAKETFTLNRFNFEWAHDFLIPRAVAYSAGLINYFFRGKIDFIEDKNNPGKYVIKNLSAEDMQGTFTLYYDAVDNNRYPVAGDAVDKTWASLAVLKNNQVDNLSFSPPAYPVPKEPGKYMLVFNGDLGEEKASTGVTVGAVAAVVANLEPDLQLLDWLLGRIVTISANGDFTSPPLPSGAILRNGSTIASGISAYKGNVINNTFSYPSGMNNITLRNTVPFTNNTYSYDTAASAAGIFVADVQSVGGVQVKVFDHNVNPTITFASNPDQYWYGGEVRIAANKTHIATTNNEFLYIYTIDGSNVATINGLNIFSQAVAMTRDRVFYVDGTILKVFDLTGAIQKILDLTSVINSPINCFEATEKRFYIVTFSGVSNFLHIFTRAVTRDQNGNILSDDYAFSKSINLGSHIERVGSCSVDTAYMDRE